MAFDTVGFIIAFEGGELGEWQIVEGIQALIDSGIVWELQGSYGRLAKQLIDEGRCHLPQSRKTKHVLVSDPAVQSHIRRQAAVCHDGQCGDNPADCL